MASILNRTLIVPPVLDHHAVALGSCPKFRVSTPNQLRIQVWDHILELLRSRRYVSMADIVDLSSLVSSSMVKIIDFRIFAFLWCNLNTNTTCLDVLEAGSSLLEDLKQCGSFLSGVNGNIDGCLYTLDEDCRMTVWTYQQNVEDGVLDSFQPDDLLRKKKKVAYVRRRRDVYNALGPGSEAESATVLAFGSLFTAPYRGSELYIDIHEAPKDHRINSVLKKLDTLSFVPEIMDAGKEFAAKKIKCTPIAVAVPPLKQITCCCSCSTPRIKDKTCCCSCSCFLADCSFYLCFSFERVLEFSYLSLMKEFSSLL